MIEKPFHVAQIVPSFKALGGVERGTIDVATALIARGNRASVVTAGGIYAKNLGECGVDVVTLPLLSKSPIGLWRNTRSIAAFIEREQVSLVHARSRAPAWSSYWACKKTGTPFLTTYHAPYNGQNALKRYYNSVMARGDLVIAISHFIKDHIIERYGDRPWFDPAKIRVIPRGIDMDAFIKNDAVHQRSLQLRSAWHLPQDLPIVALPGRLTRWKGAEHFIDALAQLKQEGVAFTGLLVGSDQGRHDYSTSLQLKIDALGMGDSIRMVGDCKDMPALYNLCTIAVVASLDPEGFGRVTAEAGAAECIAIASKHGASVDIIHDGETGYLYTPGDASALASVIKKGLLLPKKQRLMMGKGSRARVMEHFSLTQMLSKTMAVYDELCNIKGNGNG